LSNKIPFFIQEFTQEMEDAALDALRNESFVGGESVSKFKKNLQDILGQNMLFQLALEIVLYKFH